MLFFLSSWVQRLYEFRFVWVQKNVGQERGTICAHWNADYLLENLSPEMFKRVPFDDTAVAGSGKVGPVNQVNHTSWVAVVTPTDRPKSIHNRCEIELFVVLFVFSLYPFDISVGVGAFVIGLRQISSFFSYNEIWKKIL